jgi:hypothetical protein
MADRMGKPFGKIITTTPNDLNLEEGKFCKQMVTESAEFSEDLYDWEKAKVLTYIEKNSENDFIYIEFSYKELGHNEKWFKKQCRALYNDLRLIKRELLLEWLQSNDTSPFSEEQIEKVMLTLQDPVGKLFILDYYKFNFFDSIDKNIPYIVGVDVAAGLSRDDSAICIINPYTLKTVGTFRNNTVDTVDLTSILLNLCYELLPNSILAIERNSYGKSVIDNLLRTPLVSRIYYEFREVQAEQKVNDGRIVKSKIKQKVYGINTDKNSRDKMIKEILNIVVNDQPECVVDKQIYDDIRNLEIKKTGKIEHRSGEKDDGLFSYLVGRYAVTHGTNIGKFIMTTRQTKGMDPEEYKKNLNSARGYVMKFNEDNLSQNLSHQLIQEQQERKIRKAAGKDSNSMFSSIMGMNEGIF